MMKKILFISSVASEQTLSQVLKNNPQFPGLAIQKFNRLVAEGFSLNNCQVTCLSSRLNDKYEKRQEFLGGVKYVYAPSPSIRGLKQLIRSLYVFVYSFLWGISKRRDKVVVCDVLNISSSLSAILACVLSRVPTVGIITDVPTYSFNEKLTKSDVFNFKLLGWFDFYVLLTEQMNKIVNQKNRPYIVMEGIVQYATESEDNIIKKEKKEKKVLFAGGLDDLNGIPVLLKAFHLIKEDDVRLELYGYSPDEQQLLVEIEKDKRIIYHGVRPNAEVEIAEKNAMLLVNPRDINNPCVPYSFPSKNLEYMLSGTPVLTTRMCCIPTDHYNHLYFFPEKENASSYAEAIKTVLNIPLDELRRKGINARKFVLEKKNNVVQTARILDMVFYNFE